MELRGWGVVIFVGQVVVASVVAVGLALLGAFVASVGGHMGEWHGPVSPLNAQDAQAAAETSDRAFLVGFDATLFGQVLLVCVVVQVFRALRARRYPGLIFSDARPEAILVDYLFAMTAAEAAALGLWCLASPVPHLPTIPGGAWGLVALLLAACVGLTVTIRQHALSQRLAVGAAAAISLASLAATIAEPDFGWRPSALLSVAGLVVLVRNPRRALHPASDF